MTITIHIWSWLFGFFSGVVLLAIVGSVFFFDSRWNDGFSEGYKMGKESEKRKLAEQEGEE